MSPVRRIIRTYRYMPKTSRAFEVHEIIEKGLIESDRLQILVFGAGKPSKDYFSHRLAVKNLILRLNQIGMFPEDFRKNGGNLALNEYEMMQDCHYTIIIMTSVGSISEYTLYFKNERVAHKIRLFVPIRFKKSKGFLNAGLIDIFRQVHNHVYYFSTPKNLLDQVNDMIKSMIVYRRLQNI